MKGIGASSGICSGRIYKYEKEALVIERIDTVMWQPNYRYLMRP